VSVFNVRVRRAVSAESDPLQPINNEWATDQAKQAEIRVIATPEVAKS
jgi:hypothetical protein